MIFRHKFLQKIKDKEVTVAFRKWDKLSVKKGGTLKTPIGVLGFTKVSPVTQSSLTTKKAKLAGYDSLESLLKYLNQRKSGAIYQINFKLIGADPRIKLREDTRMTDEVFEAIHAKLERLDKASRYGAWTLKTLKLLKKNPGIVSTKLAPKVGLERMKFKLNVRKLKNIGLTISLETGYKISPRGLAYLKQL